MISGARIYVNGQWLCDATDVVLDSTWVDTTTSVLAAAADVALVLDGADAPFVPGYMQGKRDEADWLRARNFARASRRQDRCSRALPHAVRHCGLLRQPGMHRRGRFAPREART